MTPEHRLMKTIDTLNRVYIGMQEGLLPSDAINIEIQRLHDSENMTTLERQQMRNALEAMVRGEWWDARERRQGGN